MQLLQSKAALELRGYTIGLYNMWNPQSEFSIFHQFSVASGLEEVFDTYKNSGKKMILSPILWANFQETSEAYRYIRSLLNSSDGILTNSNIESEQIAKDFSIPREKFFKTRNSIDSKFLVDGSAELFRKATGISSEFVLSVANIDQRKNTAALVRACKKLNLPLACIGHIRDRHYFDSFKKEYSAFFHLGPSSDVEFLKSAYRACRVFALPSFCETPSIAALEAASQGAPIVITKEGSTTEYFGSSALYVDPRDDSSIEECIMHAWRNGPRSGVAAEIRRMYTWEKTAEEISAVYKNVLDSK